MSPIRTIFEGVHVQPLAWALSAHGSLWNELDTRTRDVTSPHHELDDIWVRYARPDDDPSSEHNAAWYAHVTDLLPVKEMVYDLARSLHADRIGGVLITRIPPGAICKPHIDNGWHSRFYRKFGIQIASAPGQAFCFEGVEHVTKPGDVFEFDNSQMHWVTNASREARITMIVCLRIEDTADIREGGASCPGQ